MSEENNNNSQDNNDSQELNLEEVVEVEPDKLSEEQKTFLEEKKGDLTDEQAEKFGIEKGEKEEEPEDIEPKTRAKPPKKPKEGEEEEEPDPDDERMVSSIIDKRLKEAGIGDTQDQLQLDAFIRDNPEYSKYRVNALKYMKVHPSLVAGDAVRIVSAKDQQKIGAEKEREATENARSTQGGGMTVRTPKGAGRDWSKATAEEMDAKKNEIYGRT